MLTKRQSPVAGFERTVTFNEWSFYFNPSPDLVVVSEECEYLLIIEGLILNKDSMTSDYKSLVNKILLNKYLSDDYDGQFNIILIKDDSVYVITDLININKLYYSTLGGFPELSNNLELLTLEVHNKIEKDADFIDYIGFFELLSSYHSSLNVRTPIKGISCFLNGVMMKYNANKNSFEIIDFDQTDLGVISVINIDDAKSVMFKNAGVFTKYFNEISLPISGGVDTRITLFSILPYRENCRITTFTHGEKYDIEYVLANELANKLNLPHSRISIRNLYPKIEKLNEILSSGLNLLVGKWLPVIQFLNSTPKTNRVIIIGDILDLLRAKNIKSLRSRKQRILLQLGLKKIDLNYSVDRAYNYYKSKLKSDIHILLKRYDSILSHFHLDKSELTDCILKDFDDTNNHIISIFRPTNGYQYEEVLNLFMWGRGSMGSQSRLINQLFPCYVVSANRRNVKFWLSVSALERFEDKLVHKILKTSQLSTLPTNQIPFIPYNWPLAIKYLLWAFRSMLDQYYMKFARRYGWSKNRLFRTENWQKVYQDPENTRNFHEYFKGVEFFFAYPISLYKRRSEGTARSLSEIDLTSTIIPAYLLKKISSER